jgi:hypothetical protein
LKAVSHCCESKPEEIPSTKPEIAQAVRQGVNVNLLPVATAAKQSSFCKWGLLLQNKAAFVRGFPQLLCEMWVLRSSLMFLHMGMNLHSCSLGLGLNMSLSLSLSLRLSLRLING